MGNIISRLLSDKENPGLLAPPKGFRNLQDYRRPQDSESSRSAQGVPPRSCKKTHEMSQGRIQQAKKEFLDLPKELRFMIYEELISHQSQVVILRD
ncbi:hypothetical protein J1614_005308 [Plenodomus biglobosus]|nr:hypothetical protein J1614_005308 [Plenodomus biglobosus]